MAQPLTRDLAQRVLEISFDALPQEILCKTKYCVLDYLADAVAGQAAHLPSVEIARRYAAANGGAPEAAILGTNVRVPAAEAAFVNSVSGEVLELGDGENSVIGHPGQAVIPAALAIAEKEGGVSGKAFLEAVLAGYEAFIRVGQSVMPEAYDRGFSASGCLGNFGAAVAVGRLYGFDREKMQDALALSACAAGYLRSWNLTGTMDKDLMVADSTRRGVLAGILARMGYTGSREILEGGLGFCDAMCGGAKPVALEPGQYGIQNVYFKPYPCCRATHGCIDAALALRAGGVDPKEIRHIHIHTDTRGSTVSIPEPESFVSIRFSQQYAAAAALLAGRATIREFTEEFAAQPEMKTLLRRTTISIDPELDEGWPARDYSRRITLTLDDGTERTAYIHNIKGSNENPMTWAEVEDKCRGLLRELYPEARVEQILNAVLHLEQIQDVRELAALLGA